MKEGNCQNRAESSPLNDKTKSLVLVNRFKSVPIKPISCKDNSDGLDKMLQTCYGASGNRWANFVAVDFYSVDLNLTKFYRLFHQNLVTKENKFIIFEVFLMQRSDGGGAFQAVDTLNGKLLCGCDDVHSCVVRKLI